MERERKREREEEGARKPGRERRWVRGRKGGRAKTRDRKWQVNFGSPTRPRVGPATGAVGGRSSPGPQWAQDPHQHVATIALSVDYCDCCRARRLLSRSPASGSTASRAPAPTPRRFVSTHRCAGAEATMEKRPRKPRPDPGRRRIRRMSQSALIRSAAGIRLIRRAFQIRMTDDGSDPGRRRWTSTSRGRPSRSPPTTRTPSSSGSAPSSGPPGRLRHRQRHRQARRRLVGLGELLSAPARRRRGRRTAAAHRPGRSAGPCACESARRRPMRHARRPAADSRRRSAERVIGQGCARPTRPVLTACDRPAAPSGPPRLSVPARRRIICAGATAYYLCRRDGVLSVQARRRRGRRTGAPHRA